MTDGLTSFYRVEPIEKILLLGLESVALLGGPLLSSDGLEALQTLLVLVQSLSEGSGLSWLQVDRSDGLASVELLELRLSGLVDDGKHLGDVLSHDVDLAELGGRLGGDLGNLQSSQLLSELGELGSEGVLGLLSEGSNSECLNFVSHFKNLEVLLTYL